MRVDSLSDFILWVKEMEEKQSQNATMDIILKRDADGVKRMYVMYLTNNEFEDEED